MRARTRGERVRTQGAPSLAGRAPAEFARSVRRTGLHQNRTASRTGITLASYCGAHATAMPT
eukprot:2602482-Lingulodinium_polyedra.AAC.1